MNLGDTLISVAEAMNSQFERDNATRIAALCLFKAVERTCHTFPYLNLSLKPVAKLLAMESLFLANDTAFELYDRVNRAHLDKMKPRHKKTIQRIIKTYMKNCDLLLTKERLKQYIILTIRQDIACQTLIGTMFDTCVFVAKTSLMNKRTPMQLVIIALGAIFSAIETLSEMEDAMTLNQSVSDQNKQNNQRSHDLISCYSNVAENKTKCGKFHDELLIEDILSGIGECTNKMINDSQLSKTRNLHNKRQQRIVGLLLCIFDDASFLNTLYEFNNLVNSWLNTCFTLNEIHDAIKELQMEGCAETDKKKKKKGLVDWTTRLSNPEFPLFTIKKFKFCYPNTDKIVLQNVHCDIQIQQKRWVQIKGPSGSGKSTLIKLFLKMIDCENPESFVFMGHQDYEFLSIREIVSTNCVGGGLFYETVKYNVMYSVNHCDDELVDYYFKLFGIGTFAEHCDKNINMMSSGQQQKIKVIRIILLILQRLYEPDGRHKQIFFLDEPTANMDPYSETVVLNELKTLREKYNLSFIFVSHSVAAAKYADCYLGIREDGQLYLEDYCEEDAIVLDICDT